ncbi:MAG: RecQ family ATP-dependent DNA helicase [Flavobacteriales bacterium]|nr:RecQ family ATP-dependent DNA helicase [Flavobacteriales bacterium]
MSFHYNYYEILENYWGYTEFRSNQEQIIRDVLEKKDVIALLPTGGGKSLCYQVPAIAQDGVTIVVSPLIALMMDQVKDLLDRGIKADLIFSGLSSKEIDIKLDNCVHGNTKLLFLSPERLMSELVQARISRMNVNFIAVDEAHCISEWGHDFRPSYRQIAEIKSVIPNVNILALTASATSEVVKDIGEILTLNNPEVYRSSFDRPNITYIVRHPEKKYEKIAEVLKSISGVGLIYANSRKETQEISKFLRKIGVRSDFYHAGLSNDERTRKQNAWMQNELTVLVSTSAFGMGINKGDVRFVIHTDLPNSLEAYYQESGRAGRDGNKAFAILLCDELDKLKQDKLIVNSFPDIQFIRRIYQALMNYFQIAEGSGEFESYPFDFYDFARTYELDVLKSYHALNVLQKENHFTISDNYRLKSRLKIIASRQVLYEHQVKNPRINALVTNLLRSYSGLFDEYVTISEFKIGHQLETSKVEIEKLLELLHKQELMDYVKQSETPYLTLSKPRIKSSHIKVSRALLSNRKKQVIKQVKAARKYSYEDGLCRRYSLLQYFDEESSKSCGNCDVCLEQKRTLKDMKLLTDKVKTLLSQGISDVNELYEELSDQDRGSIMTCLRSLVDDDFCVLENDVVITSK